MRQCDRRDTFEVAANECLCIRGADGWWFSDDEVRVERIGALAAVRCCCEDRRHAIKNCLTLRQRQKCLVEALPVRAEALEETTDFIPSPEIGRRSAR